MPLQLEAAYKTVVKDFGEVENVTSIEIDGNNEKIVLSVENMSAIESAAFPKKVNGIEVELQQATYKTGDRSTVDAVGRSRLTTLKPGASIGQRGDAAVAALNGTRPVALPALMSGVVINGNRPVVIGDELEKSGRTTGVTRGRVTKQGIYYLRYSVGRSRLTTLKPGASIGGCP